VTLFCRAEDDEGNKGEATATVEDVVQGNKGSATIETASSYDTGRRHNSVIQGLPLSGG
jgi:hypothetical protein